MANYDFVVNSHFNPFSLQEMLTPFAAYKEEFDKTEEAYDKLADANNFEYLSKTLPEGSKAREIYEGYANDLNAQAQDFAQNGLTMGNRGALTTLKRRYKGEIGRLIKADEAMKEEKKLRQTINAQDSSRLYAEDNLSIDNFLDGSNPNLYSISGKEIYARGAAAGKAASSRVFNFGEGEMTLGGYYRDLVSKNGLSPEVLNKFMQDMNSIPELKASFDNYMVSSGIEGNLKGVNKERAAKEYLSGVLDGAIYQVNHSPQRDLDKIDAATQAQMDLTKRGQDISLASNGMNYDDKTHTVTYDMTKDPSVSKATAIATAKAKAEEEAAKNGVKNGTAPKSKYDKQLKNGLKITWTGDYDDKTKSYKKTYSDILSSNDDVDNSAEHEGTLYNYEDFTWPEIQNEIVKAVGMSQVDNYLYFYKSKDEGGPSLEIIPMKIIKDNASSGEGDSSEINTVDRT